MTLQGFSSLNSSMMQQAVSKLNCCFLLAVSGAFISLPVDNSKPWLVLVVQSERWSLRFAFHGKALSTGRDDPSRVWGSPGTVALQLFAITCPYLLSPQALLSRGKELLHKAIKNQVSSLGWALLGLGVLRVLLSRAEPVPALLHSPALLTEQILGLGKARSSCLWPAGCCAVLLVSAGYEAVSSNVVPLRPVPAIWVLNTREL